MLPQKGDGRYNYVVGVIQGTIFMFGVAFMDPTTVIPVFVKHFTSSDFLVGLASSIHRTGWHLPQLFIAGWVERHRFRLPIYLKANTVRMVLLWSFIPILGLYGAESPGLVLKIFLVMYAVSHLAGGVAGLPFSDLVGKTITREHWGTFYALRFMLGHGVFSILAGIIIRHILASGEIYPFPSNFVLIFSLAAALMMAGYLTLSFLRESPGEVETQPRSWSGVLKEVPSILRQDVNYRRMFGVQLFASGGGLAMPFYIVVAREQFDVDVATTGLFLAVQTAGVVVSNAVWGWISARFGNRSVVRWTTVCQLSVPLYTLWVLVGQGSSDGIDAVTLFLPIFFLMGAAVSGSFVGFKSYLLDIAPEARRPTYIGISNTMMGFASLFPALGGVLAEAVGHPRLFVLAAISVAWSLWLVRGLTVR